MIFFILPRSVEGHEPLWCLCGETTTWEEDGYTEVKLKKQLLTTVRVSKLCRMSKF